MSRKYTDSLLRNHYFRFNYSREDIQLLQIKALLHDVGHYPFAHYFEELGVIEEDSIELDHEYYTKEILKGNLMCISSGQEPAIAQVLNDTVGVSGERLIDIGNSDDLLNSIVDGPIDCDKLDYLIRDGIAAGVPYAASIDIERFLSSLTCVDTNTRYPTIGVTSKGVAAVETVLMAKYQLFSEVYWHKTCRAVAAMIKHALWTVVKKQGYVTQDEFNHVVMTCGDEGFLMWLFNKLSAIDSSAGNDLVGSLVGIRKPYKRLITYSSVWAERQRKKAPYYVITEKCRHYNEVCDVKDNIILALNTFGKKKSHWKPIKDHEVLLDIPPADKDIFEGLAVSYAEDSLGKGEYKFEEVSPLLKTMTDRYLLSTKKLRIFVTPRIHEQINEHEECRQIIHDAIVD